MKMIASSGRHKSPSANGSRVVCNESQYFEDLVTAVEANPIAGDEDQGLSLRKIPGRGEIH